MRKHIFDISAWLLIAFACVVVFLIVESNNELNARRQKYFSVNHCVVEGYAGRHATPYYRCDNGLTRWQDIE